MNLYLYPWHDLDGNNQIGSIYAKSFNNCKEKLVEYLTEQYDDLNDTLEYDEFIEQLGETYGVYIGDIYDITEFNNDSNSTRFR